MERLSFGFYRGVFDQIDKYEKRFGQLRRDYDRELRGQMPIFAVDYSELYNYAHLPAADANRVEINTRILNTLDDRLTILPGAMGEMLSDLERILPGELKSDFLGVLYHHPAVARFRELLQGGTWDEEQLLEAYAEAEVELRSALGELLQVVVRGVEHTWIGSLRQLLDKRLTPIAGIRQLGPVPPETKNLSRFVESHLTLSRPGLSWSNQIDALDFTVAWLLNNEHLAEGNGYLTIYTGADSLILALRSHEDLQWDGDYLVRDLKYFWFRTRLQEMYGNLQQRHEHVVGWCQLALQVKSEISALVDIHERIKEGVVTSSLVLVDLYRRFEEECINPFWFRETVGTQPTPRERAFRLYEILRDEQEFKGRVDDAYGVLKEHLRRIHEDLQAFNPQPTDTHDARRYKAGLRVWLGLDEADREAEVEQLGAKE